MRIPACLLALLCPLSVVAQTPVDRCLSDFLSGDGDWQARSFDGRTVRGEAFTPISAVYVRNGRVHATVWLGEAHAALVESAGTHLVFKTPYPAFLPGMVDGYAKRLEPFARSEHRLVIPGRCRAPTRFTIEILVDGRTHVVALVRVPTSTAEFQAL